MTIAKITGPGLVAISLAVAALWGCFVTEQVTARRAVREQAQILHELRQLRQRLELTPVSSPAPRPSRPIRPSAG